MRIIKFKTEKALDTFVGKYLVDYINQYPNCTLGFATGSTPLGTYKYLIGAYQKKDVDFSQVYAFSLDEYVGVSKNHPRSFYKFMQDNLFKHINLPSSHIDGLDGSCLDMVTECERYENAILNRPIDIQLLGIGMDGHIAYNEPGSPLDGGCHVVDLHQESIESSLDYGFIHIEDVPKQGVTQGIGTIMRAKQLIMMAKGKKKAHLVKRMIEGEVSIDFPCSIIQRHPNVIVVLDIEAGSELKEETE